MDKQVLEVGERIRASLAPGMSQRALAEHVDMTPDALSRALNGQRGFSILELTRIAESLQVDLNWLITGRPDPHRIAMAARHQWDPERRTRSNPSEDRDQDILQRVAETYRAAYPDGPPASEPLPKSPEAVRTVLGSGFVSQFAERAEEQLGVDVVRLPGLGTDYSLTVGQRGIIVLNAIPNWFRSNWSLAHELGHLALGHHVNGSRPTTAQEHEADEFAADVLLPEPLVRAKAWTQTDESELAFFLWNVGVSTHALRTRLTFLRISASERVTAALDDSTLALLRRHGREFGGRTAIAQRQQRSAQRRLPVGMLASLTERVESGAEMPEPLAWALDVDVDDVDFPAPVDPAEARLPEASAERPSLEQLRQYFTSA